MNTLLPQVFQWVLVSSAKGGILVAIILVTKSLLKNRLGASWHYAIWALLFLQLVLPWTPSSPLSIYKLFPATLVDTIIHSNLLPTKSAELPSSDMSSSSSLSGLTQGQNSATVSNPSPMAFPLKIPATTPVRRLWDLAQWLWLAGFAFFAFRMAKLECLFRIRLKNSKPVADLRLLSVFQECIRLAGARRNIILMETDALKGPALFGLFRTRMLLPARLADNLTSQQLSHIFLHELIHHNRHDIAANWIAGALRAVHWFNPLIWYGFNRWQEDQELSCDALAVRYLNSDAVQDYGHTLIRVLELAGPKQPQLLSTVGVSGGKSISKRRIMMITLLKKTSFKWTVVGIAAIIAIALVGMTLPKANDMGAKSGGSPSQSQGSAANSGNNQETGSGVQAPASLAPSEQPSQNIVYRNPQYGFSFTLPASWKGYSIIADTWEGLPIGVDQVVATGPMLSIRHPLWTSENKRQDIPIMIFTLDQWNSLKEGKFHIGAAPIEPSELGRNNAYVFALPARYNYAFPAGYEEVEQILNNKPLQPENITIPKPPSGSAVTVTGDYFPLHKGDKWVYRGEGNEYASFSREVLFTEGNLAQILERNGGADVTKIFQITGSTVTEVFKRVEQSAPVNLLHEKANEQRILLKAPLLTGTKWNDGDTQFEIVDTAATVKTPAGTFANCLKIRSVFSADSSVMYQYYAKGVGMVEQDFITGGEKISSSLESYYLAK